MEVMNFSPKAKLLNLFEAEPKPIRVPPLLKVSKKKLYPVVPTKCKISSVSNNWIWVFLDEKRSTERHGFLFEHGSGSAIPFGMTMEPVS